MKQEPKYIELNVEKAQELLWMIEELNKTK
jgi:hypothetical protein